MKIEKKIVVDSKWSMTKRVAVAAAMGFSVCLPLSACNEDDSSPVAPVNPVEQSSPSTEPDSSAEQAPASSADISPQSSSAVEPNSSDEGVISSGIPLPYSVIADESSSSAEEPASSADVPPASSAEVQPTSSEAILPTSSAEVQPTSSAAESSSDSVVPVPASSSEEVQCEENHIITSPFDPCIPDDYPMVSMASPIGHIQIPLINV